MATVWQNKATATTVDAEAFTNTQTKSTYIGFDLHKKMTFKYGSHNLNIASLL